MGGGPPGTHVGVDEAWEVRRTAIRQSLAGAKRQRAYTEALQQLIEWSHVIMGGRLCVLSFICALLDEAAFRDNRLPFFPTLISLSESAGRLLLSPQGL